MSLREGFIFQFTLSEAPLGPECRDHQLSGNYAGHSECHIGGAFLLAYKLHESGKNGLVVFIRARTNPGFFGWLSRES